MRSEYPVIVVGLGAMGSATCYELARRGTRVLGIEQFGVPHSLGSSHGYSRAIRMAYYEHPDYVPLLRRSYELWRQLEQQCGVDLLTITGGLYMGGPTSELVSGSIRAARTHALPYEELNRSQLAKRFPQFALPDDHIGMYEEQAGFIRPELAVSVTAEAAMTHGAELHGHERVIDWQLNGDVVEVSTDRQAYYARRIVFCGGAWSSRLLRPMGVNLVVTRQVTGWVWPRTPKCYQLGHFPVWGIEADDSSLYYGFPMLKDNVGVKVARHWHANPVDPDSIVRDPMPGDESEFRLGLERYLPTAAGPTLSIRTCMYTNSPDSHFIIDRWEEHPEVVIACGFSGHGFKFMPVVGEALADLALTGYTALPVEFLGLNRFRGRSTA